MSAHEDEAGKACSECGTAYDAHAWLSPDCPGETAGDVSSEPACEPAEKGER